MDTKIKSRPTRSVTSTIGQPVGVFPVMVRDRPPAPLSRTVASTAGASRTEIPARKRSGTNRNKQTGQERQQRGSSRERIRRSPGVSRRKVSLSREDSYDEDDCIGQDVKLIDVQSGDRSATSSRLSVSSVNRELKSISPDMVLKQSQETDYNKVYEVDLHASDIGHIDHLEQFKKLRVLDLSCNEIEKIRNLENNQDLRELKLYDNKIQTIEKLDRLKELCHLQLQHNKVRNIGKGLSYLKKLKILRLDSNQILRIEPAELAGCSQITVLDISNNMLDNLSALNSLPNLTELISTNNRLKTVGDLGRCRKLQGVDLSYNRLTDVSGLKGLPQLQSLNVSNNQLSSLKEVGKLKFLQELSISDNRFSSVSSFNEQFPNLEVLNVGSNKLQNVADVVVLKALSLLVELYVSGNPFTQSGAVSQSDFHADLPQLEILDGVTLKKPCGKPFLPLMRPMSASSVVSLRYVENQMKTLTEELQSFETSFAKRFESFREVYDSLPSETPSRPVSRKEGDDSQARPSASRCSSRSKIKLAQEFAASQELAASQKLTASPELAYSQEF